MLEGEKAQEYRVILVLRKIKKHVFKPFFFQNKFPQFLDFSKIELTELHVKKSNLGDSTHKRFPRLIL